MDGRRDSNERTPVAIVGAGPVGLALGLGLARHGVASVILERKHSTSERSKAPGIQLRTREIFRQWGIEESIVGAGVLLQKVHVHSPGRHRPLMSLDFRELEGEADRPGIEILEQGETERLLLEAVRASGLCEVRFAAEAVGLLQDADGMYLSVREGDTERILKAEYAVGCDGASSFVRDALHLPFDGLTYSIRPMLADVRIKDERDRLPWPRMHDGQDGVTAALRLRPGLWRIIRLERGEADKADEIPRQEIEQRLSEVLGQGPFECIWGSRFRIHLRSAPRFRVGRVLLAGDAAHIHSPAGGQGMNAGIQDAHNLAWKLAAALRGGDTERLLQSFDVERRAVAVASVSRYTDFVTRVFLQSPPVLRRTAFGLLRLSLALPKVRTLMLRRTAMIDLGYSDSPLVDSRERAAGKRLPNPMLRSPDGKEVRLYDLLPNAPAMLDVAEHRAHAGDLPVDHVIRIGRDGWREPSGLLRSLLEGRDGWILVRPDTHIAWARHSLDGISDATRRALGEAAHS